MHTTKGRWSYFLRVERDRTTLANEEPLAVEKRSENSPPASTDRSCLRSNRGLVASSISSDEQPMCSAEYCCKNAHTSASGDNSIRLEEPQVWVLADFRNLGL